MNNNTNMIFDAIGELDNEILENAFKKKKKKPVALFVIAGAAALSLLIGAAHIQPSRTKVFVGGEWAFDIITKPHPECVLLPVEELTEMGVTDIRYDTPEKYIFGDNSKNYTYTINSTPGEIIRKYNLKPLINDNFSEEVTIDDFPEGTDPHEIALFSYRVDLDRLLPGTEVCISSDDGGDAVQFYYFMLDKQEGIPVYVKAYYRIIDRVFDFNDWNGSALFPGGDDSRIVELNSGEKAIASRMGSDKAMILFAYDNAEYMMITKASVDEAVQILENLGIAAE